MKILFKNIAMGTFRVDGVVSFMNHSPKLYSVEYPLIPDEQFKIQLHFKDKTFQFKKGTCFIMKRIHGHPFRDGKWVGFKEEYQFFQYVAYKFQRGAPPSALLAKVYYGDKDRFSTGVRELSFEDVSLFIDTLQFVPSSQDLSSDKAASKEKPD